MDRNTRLAERRERKFAERGIEIVEESHTEIRGEEPVEFKFAIHEKGRLVGRTRTHRSALKRAHQFYKDINVRRR